MRRHSIELVAITKKMNINILNTNIQLENDRVLHVAFKNERNKEIK